MLSTILADFFAAQGFPFAFTGIAKNPPTRTKAFTA
jgi:hypothetical protein